MKSANVMLAVVLVSIMSLSACETNEVDEMVVDQPGTEKMTADDYVYDSDILD